MISGYRMLLAGSKYKLVEMTRGADLGYGEDFDGEVAGDDEYDEGMEVVRQEGCLYAPD